MLVISVLLPAFAVSLCTVYVAKPLAWRVGLVDRPGGHKSHSGQVPLIGGLAIFAGLSLAWFLAPRLGLSTINSFFAAAGGLLFFVGLIDDHRQLSVRFRFGAQIIAACLLLYSNVVVSDLGPLFGDAPFELYWLAMPVTVFAVVGAINALNMMDGMDGLAGSVSLVSFALLSGIALGAGNTLQALILLCVIGGLLGFLCFNMPIPGRKNAHIFMGDAGSTLLGFLLANSLIVLSQGEQRAMAPVTALWIFAIPLLDTVGVMLRRIWLGRSPFAADRGHIHHLFLDAGFRIRHTVFLIAVLQCLLGVTGLALERAGAPHWLSLGLFGLMFAGYIYLISRPWRLVPRLRTAHRRIGWVAEGVEEVYVAGLKPDTAVEDMFALLGSRAADVSFEIYSLGDGGEAPVFALAHPGGTDRVGSLVQDLRGRLQRKQRQGCAGLANVTEVRQFVKRREANDRRAPARDASRSVIRAEKRGGDRRKCVPRMVYRSTQWPSHVPEASRSFA